MFGGYNPNNNPATISNDLWALDLTAAISNGATGWVQVSPPGDATTGVVAGYPPARVGYSWTGYEVGVRQRRRARPAALCRFRLTIPLPKLRIGHHVWRPLRGERACRDFLP
jgi:hypothetical protein